MILMHKFYGGKVESESGTIALNDDFIDTELRRHYDELERSLESYKFRQGLQTVMEIARLGNRYLTEKEPWRRLKPIRKMPNKPCIIAWC